MCRKVAAGRASAAYIGVMPAFLAKVSAVMDWLAALFVKGAYERGKGLMRSQNSIREIRVLLSLHSSVLNISLSRDLFELRRRRDFRAHLAAFSSKASEPTGLAHFLGFDLAK